MLRVAEQTHRLAFRVDEIQRAAISRSTARAGVSMSEWIRWACDAVMEVQDEPVNPFIERHKARQR